MRLRSVGIAAPLCGVLLVAPGCEPAKREPAATPRVAPGSGLSEAGLYRLALRPQDAEVPLGQLHGWVVHVETADGDPFVPQRLAFSGGMPQHGHGFVTEPRVTRAMPTPPLACFIKCP